MTTIGIADLPDPHPALTWPRTEEGTLPLATLPANQEWPRISTVTLRWTREHSLNGPSGRFC